MATTPADNLKAVPLPKNTMVVAREDGRLYVVDFTEYPQLDDPGAVDWDVSVAKLILGKIQHTRSRYLTMEEIILENVIHTGQAPTGTSADLEVTLFSSLDGKNISETSKPYVAENDGQYIKLTTRKTAQNFSIQIRGAYSLNTIALTFHNAGRR